MITRPNVQSWSWCHTEKNIRNLGVVDRIFDVRGPGQTGRYIIDLQCRELVRHTVPLFNMATAHDADD
jgi:hypothetical protein